MVLKTFFDTDYRGIVQILDDCPSLCKVFELKTVPQPNGKLYDGNGIQPDVMIEPAPTDFIGKTDSTLEAAIRRLQQIHANNN